MPLRFDAALADLMQKVFTMARLTETMMDALVLALTERRKDALQGIYDSEKELDRLQVDVDSETVEMISVYTPVAADLRLLLMVPRVSGALERVGDQAEKVSHVVLDDLASEPLSPLDSLSRMAVLGREMLHKALQAFVQRDTALALDVLRMDAEVDALNTRQREELTAQMERSPGQIRRVLGLLRLTRAIERLADHAGTIAEATIFVVRGKDVRHLHVEQSNTPNPLDTPPAGT